MTRDLYSASVPVCLHYLDRADALLARTGGDVLSARLAPDMFSAAEQFATAAGFALRATYPLVGREVPDFPDLGLNREGLTARVQFAREHLNALSPNEFEDAESRRVQHRAGFAELDQSGVEYLHLFAMPNFLFHLSMAFAILRQNGVEVGKADFDGLHDYPQGFRF